MQWNSVGDFFAMGGYAFYVWGSFGITALVVIIEMLLVRGRRKEVVDQLRSEFLADKTSS